MLMLCRKLACGVWFETLIQYALCTMVAPYWRSSFYTAQQALIVLMRMRANCAHAQTDLLIGVATVAESCE